MKTILGLTFEEFQSDLQAAGMKAFVARQAWEWICDKGEEEIDRWSNVSRGNRDWLKENYRVSSVRLQKIAADKDGTKKMLIGLDDGLHVEAVLIPEKNHHTFCLSTQVGCPLDCRFCATGNMGFSRNLASEEILAQVLLLKKQLGPRPGKINIVFMGMGEPLLNYSQLAKAMATLTSPAGFHVSPRHVTVSTAGILEGLVKLEKDFPLVKIALSLNAPDPELRRKLMPHSARHPLGPILDHFRNVRRRQRITFEYVMIQGKNDAPAHARLLARLIHGIAAKINLIPYNENPQFAFRAPDEGTLFAFQKILLDKGYTVAIRWSKGQGIRSACGQLATAARGSH